MVSITLQFDKDLHFLLRRGHQDGRCTVTRRQSAPSIKDAIESCGVPHPEVDLILKGGRPVDFSHPTADGEVFLVFPVNTDRASLLQGQRQGRLQECPLVDPRFIADVHLGRLARLLRMLGFDTRFDPAWSDSDLLAIMADENRAILTRDRRLLMVRSVVNGYCPRSDQGQRQAVEVVRRFGLAGRMAPLKRCMRCNGLLEQVSKEEVLDRLEPLTKRYYHQFVRCVACDQVFWRGSHYEAINRLIVEIVEDAGG